ncbi:hypothetical protein BT93_L4585 [Corymbia citriodora subsp. variegata]|uniref:Peptidase A1 domain-containing protein n=1 Tax=Corymbia citriodora subsp. variegata TaxID=360336 RepID=A0A8T0CXG5_CORYI|nr:hypothetical protein BT93_L4585 [Corymbia citriodora subsp. variegata]
MKMSTLLLSLILAWTLSSQVFAQPHTLVAPILQHVGTNTTLYSITLNGGEHYIIDLDAPFTWCQCQSPQPVVGCNSGACAVARSYIPPSCPVNNTFTDSQCYCNDAPVNPITKSCAPSQSTYKDIVLYWTDGRSMVGAVDFNRLYVSCAPPSLLQSLPEEVIGVGALSWSSLALLSEFTDLVGQLVTKKFALCLPGSSEARGVTFFGDGPYYLDPSTDFDAAKVLTYTPLQRDPTSLGYFINLTGISINGKAMNVPQNGFNVNQSVKLSTIVPYTKLKSNIYKTFIRDFKKAAKGIVQVANVDPFHLCFNTSTMGSSIDRLLIPQVDLMLGNGEKWTIYGSNSIKQVNDNVGCLAFIDGGETAEQAVVIGTYQIEDNLLQFDLDQSRLGFSSSLLPNGTTCGSFNFAD